MADSKLTEFSIYNKLMVEILKSRGPPEEILNELLEYLLKNLVKKKFDDYSEFLFFYNKKKQIMSEEFLATQGRFSKRIL